jgi:hypothetical protein
MNMTITYNMEIVNQWLHVCMVAYPLGLERNAFGSKTFLRLNVHPFIEVKYINPTILREIECKRQVDTPLYILGIGLILYDCMYE